MSVTLSDVRVVRDAFVLEVDAALEPACTAVLGPSGSGKTTLLECVAGLIRPDRGRIAIDGDVVSDASGDAPSHAFVPAWQRRVGLVPQDGALFQHLSVRKNLGYGYGHGDGYGGRGDASAFERVSAVLGIGELLDRRVPSLSGGEKRRVALGRALLSAPRLLLLDEPLTGLDRALKERAIALLRRVREELRVPMLLVTHDDWEASQLADAFIRLDAGRIVEKGALGR